MKRRLESPPSSSEQADRDLDISHESGQLRPAPLPDPLPRWLTPAQAMTYLQIESLSALYRLIHQQRLPFGRMGKRYRFSPTQMDQWLASRGGVVGFAKRLA